MTTQIQAKIRVIRARFKPIPARFKVICTCLNRIKLFLCSETQKVRTSGWHRAGRDGRAAPSPVAERSVRRRNEYARRTPFRPLERGRGHRSAMSLPGQCHVPHAADALLANMLEDSTALRQILRCQGPWNVDLRTPPGQECSNGSLLCIRRGHPGTFEFGMWSAECRIATDSDFGLKPLPFPA
jgi:hypothetical protein